MKTDLWNRNILPAIAAVCLFLAFPESIRSQERPSAPDTWSIVASYSIPGKASGLAWDGNYIYFGIYGLNGDDIYKFSPSSGTATLLCSGPFEDAFGLTYKAPNLVTIKQPSSSSQPATALEFNMSGTQVSSITLPDHYMSGIAYDNGNYWVCTYYDDPGIVYHINSSGTVLSQFVPPNNQPWDICLQGSDLWIADYYGNMLYKVTTTGALIESHASQILKPSGVVYDGTYLWYCAGELGSASTLYKVDLQGSGTPAITVPVTLHNFGTVTTGTSATWNCQVSNTGSANLVLNSFQTNPGVPVSTTLNFPATITPGNSLNLPVVYSPVVPGGLDTYATINSNDPVHPSIVIHLTGNAVVPGPHLNITQTSHDWGDRRKGAFSRWYLPVGNNGNENLVISGFSFSDGSFTTDPGISFPLTIVPLQTRNLGIWFHPVDGTGYSGILSISSNDTTQDPFIVQLQGNGIDTVYPTGTPLWSYRISGSFDQSPKAIRPLQDITGDSVCDVLIASEENFIRCMNGNSSGEADVMWATNIPSGSVYSQNGLTTINDIDNDGIRDVVIGTTGGDASVRVLSGKTGEPLWQYDTHAFGGGGWVYQVDARLDYNGDGSPDVLACAGDDGNGTGPRRVFCLNGLTGQPIWICPTGGAVFVVAAVDDINGDGKPDAVAGATNAGQDQAKVYGINGANGAILWTDTPASTATWALLPIDDVTGDGIADVASGNFSGMVYFHNAVTGARVKSTVIGSGDIILRMEDMGDVDGDGHPDILVAHSGPTAVMISGQTATHLWSKPLADQSWNVANLGDITWDGINDAGIGTLFGNNRTYFLDGTDGEILEDVGAAAAVDALGAIPDIVGDHTMELVSGDRDGLVVCYSGGYDTTQTAVPGDRGRQNSMVHIYPNPCNNVLHVAVEIRNSSDISLSLMTAAGKQIHYSSFPDRAAGRNIFEINRKSTLLFPAGLCILEVRTDEGIQHLKVVFD